MWMKNKYTYLRHKKKEKNKSSLLLGYRGLFTFFSAPYSSHPLTKSTTSM